MTPTLSPTERRDLLRVLNWCGPDMVEWGLLAWENRKENGECLPSSRGDMWKPCSCFVGEMGGGEPPAIGYGPSPFDALWIMAAMDKQALWTTYTAFEQPDWRTAARPIIEDWLAKQRGAA